MPQLYNYPSSYYVLLSWIAEISYLICFCQHSAAECVQNNMKFPCTNMQAFLKWWLSFQYRTTPIFFSFGVCFQKRWKNMTLHLLFLLVNSKNRNEIEGDLLVTNISSSGQFKNLMMFFNREKFSRGSRSYFLLSSLLFQMLSWLFQRQLVKKQGRQQKVQSSKWVQNRFKMGWKWAWNGLVMGL